MTLLKTVFSWIRALSLLQEETRSLPSPMWALRVVWGTAFRPCGGVPCACTNQYSPETWRNPSFDLQSLLYVSPSSSVVCLQILGALVPPNADRGPQLSTITSVSTGSWQRPPGSPPRQSQGVPRVFIPGAIPCTSCLLPEQAASYVLSDFLVVHGGKAWQQDCLDGHHDSHILVSVLLWLPSNPQNVAKVTVYIWLQVCDCVT